MTNDNSLDALSRKAEGRTKDMPRTRPDASKSSIHRRFLKALEKRNIDKQDVQNLVIAYIGCIVLTITTMINLSRGLVP